MKKRKINILLNIAVLCMCVCAIAIGVYSAKTASLNVGGTIGFNAHNCKVRVLGKITGAVDSSNNALPESTASLNYQESASTGKLIDGTSESWDFGKIYFDDLNVEGNGVATNIVFTFTLTNESAYDVIATLNVDKLPDSVQPYVAFSSGSNYSGYVCELKKDKTQVTITLKLILLTSEQIQDATNNINLSLSFEKVNQNQTATALGYTFSNGNISGVPATTDTNASLTFPSYFYDNGVAWVQSLDNNGSKLTNANLYSTISIPNNVTSVGNFAFINCTNITSLTFPINNDISLGICSFSNIGIKTLVLPSSVRFLGDSTFYDCSELTTLKIMNCSDLGQYTFSSCAKLSSVVFPSSKTTIGRSAFSYCDGLISITIPSSVTDIDLYAFKYCSGLTSIIIPKSVKTIGCDVFSDCTKLTSITFENPDNWQYSTDNDTYNDFTSGMSFADPTVNATKFKGVWVNYYFRQKGTN